MASPKFAIPLPRLHPVAQMQRGRAKCKRLPLNMIICPIVGGATQLSTKCDWLTVRLATPVARVPRSRK